MAGADSPSPGPKRRLKCRNQASKRVCGVHHNATNRFVAFSDRPQIKYPCGLWRCGVLGAYFGGGKEKSKRLPGRCSFRQRKMTGGLRSRVSEKGCLPAFECQRIEPPTPSLPRPTLLPNQQTPGGSQNDVSNRKATFEYVKGGCAQKNEGNIIKRLVEIRFYGFHDPRFGFIFW
jgi:hypothetical protein